MAVIASAFTNGYGSNPVISGAAAANEVLTSSSATAAAWQLGMVQQAATPVAGYALVNSTGAVISWTTPNDGKQHRVTVFASMDVTSPTTGGQITCHVTMPDGTSATPQLFAGSQGAGFNFNGFTQGYVIEANSTFSVFQQTSMAAGAATLWAEIWGS